MQKGIGSRSRNPDTRPTYSPVNFTREHVEHVGQITGEYVGQGIGEHAGRGTGGHVGKVTGEHVGQVTGEHIGRGTGEDTCCLSHW